MVGTSGFARLGISSAVGFRPPRMISPMTLMSASRYFSRNASGSGSESRTVLYRRDDRSYAQIKTSQQFDSILFVDTDQAVNVQRLRYVDERQRHKIPFDKRDVGGQSRRAFVDVDEGLQVGKLNHQEERLLKRVANSGCLFKQNPKELFDQLWNRRGNVSRGTDRNGRLAKTPRICPVVQEIVREQGVQVCKCIAIDADLLRGIDQQFDGCLVVQDHLSFFGVFPRSCCAALDKRLRIEQ